MNELSDLISEIKDGGKLVLEHGREYHLFADDCFIYETKKTAESEGEAIRAAVFLSGKKNVTIDGGGSALKIHGDITPLLFIGCKNIRVKNLTVNFACDGCETAGSTAHCPKPDEKTPQTAAQICPKGTGAYIGNCDTVLLENMRFKGFSGTAVFAKDSKDVTIRKTECALSENGSACDGFFRFENCRGKAVADGCTARGKSARGDFLYVRGGEKCDLTAKNNCAGENAGRGVYYACRGKAFVAGNTFFKTGGAALCAKDFGGKHGAFCVKKVVFENNVVDGCGNAYEDKYSVAYFPACVPANGAEKSAPKNRPVGKFILSNNHFFNPENEEHRIYISDLKRAALKNNSFDRPYKIGRENVKRLTKKNDIAAEKCK